MSNLINYAATRANTCKIWYLMARVAPTELSFEQDFRLWPFHDMSMNHIKILGWITSIVFTKSSIDDNIARDFVQVRVETIEKYYQVLEISTQPTDNIKKLKLCVLYTWLFNSSDKVAQYFLAK